MSALRDTFLKYLHQIATFAQAQTANINTPDLGYQWLIVLFVLLVLVIGMFMLGRSRGVLMIIALYIAAFVESHFVYYLYIKNFIHAPEDWWLRAGLFVLLAIVIFMLLTKTYLQKRVSTAESSSWSVIPLTILAMGFLTSTLLSFIVIDSIISIPALLQTIFTTTPAPLIWTIIPLIGILFLDRG